MKTKKLFGVGISLGSYQEFIDRIMEIAKSDKSSYICITNVHAIIEAYKAESFAEVVNNADMVTPDGTPLAWALRYLYDIKQERVAGMDLLPDLLFAAERQNLPVAFYGGTTEMLKRTEEFIRNSHPKLLVTGMYSPPFRLLTSDEERFIINMFNESGARMIFVVLGCPKQEKWMYSMKGKINALMIGIGGALPVLVGIQKRAPQWMQHAGLEWFFRLSQEPRRLFKRYATTNFMFLYLALKEKFASKN